MALSGLLLRREPGSDSEESRRSSLTHGLVVFEEDALRIPEGNPEGDFGGITAGIQPLSPIRSCSSRWSSPSPRRLWTNSHGSTSEANEELPAGTRTYFSTPGSLREVPASPKKFSPPKRVRRFCPVQRVESPKERGDACSHELGEDQEFSYGSFRLRPGELPEGNCQPPSKIQAAKSDASQGDLVAVSRLTSSSKSKVTNLNKSTWKFGRSSKDSSKEEVKATESACKGKSAPKQLASSKIPSAPTVRSQRHFHGEMARHRADVHGERAQPGACVSDVSGDDGHGELDRNDGFKQPLEGSKGQNYGAYGHPMTEQPSSWSFTDELHGSDGFKQPLEGSKGQNYGAYGHPMTEQPSSLSFTDELHGTDGFKQPLEGSKGQNCSGYIGHRMTEKPSGFSSTDESDLMHGLKPRVSANASPELSEIDQLKLHDRTWTASTPMMLQAPSEVVSEPIPKSYRMSPGEMEKLEQLVEGIEGRNSSLKQGFDAVPVGLRHGGYGSNGFDSRGKTGNLASASKSQKGFSKNTSTPGEKMLTEAKMMPISTKSPRTSRSPRISPRNLRSPRTSPSPRSPRTSSSKVSKSSKATVSTSSMMGPSWKPSGDGQVNFGKQPTEVEGVQPVRAPGPGEPNSEITSQSVCQSLEGRSVKSGKIMKVKAENGTNGTSEVENESDDAKEAEVSSTGKTGKGKGGKNSGKNSPLPEKVEPESSEKPKGKGKLPPPAAPSSLRQKGEGKKGKGKGKTAEAEEIKAMMRKPEVIPSVQVKRLFWNPIHLRANHASYTVWDAIDGEGYPIDLQELEWLFSEIKSPRGKSEADRGETGKRVIRVLDEQRRRQVCIMLARLPGSAMNVLSWINEINSSRLGKDEVELLLHNSPSPEEVQLLRRAQEENVIDENNVWDTAEDFMLSLIAIPRFQLRLKVWDFVNSFQEKFEHVANDVTGISRGCDCLLSSMRMRHLLGVALHAGNFLNGGTPRGRADGFSMDALLQLRTVKATQAADQTLVHFIAMQMEKRYPGEMAGIFLEGEEAFWIRAAARRRIEDAAQECNALLGQATHMMKTIRLVLEDDPDFEGDSSGKAVLQHFVEQLAMCTADLENLQSRQGRVGLQYENLLVWLHIDADHKKPSDELFGIWNAFLQDVQSARRSIIEKEQAAQRKRPMRRLRRIRSSPVNQEEESSLEPSSATRSVPVLRLHNCLSATPSLEEASAASSSEQPDHPEVEDSSDSSSTTSGGEAAMSRLPVTQETYPKADGENGDTGKLVEVNATDGVQITQEVLDELKSRRGSAFQCLTGERSRKDGVVELTFEIPAAEGSEASLHS